MKTDSNRVHFLDFIRGCAVIGMLIFHAIYDLNVFFAVDISFMDYPLGRAISNFGVILFVLVSGICTGFSRNSLKRGSIVLAAALLVSGVTIFFVPDQRILFGILSFMGSAMIITSVLKKGLEKIPRNAGLLIMSILFGITFVLFPVSVPWKYLFPIGLVPSGFFSADYYPLIPWLFCYWFGFYLSGPVKEKKFPSWFYTFSCPPVNFIGRHALWVYLLQQPVLMAVFQIVFWMVTT